MKLVCPSCGAACAADAWENDAEARETLKTALSLPGPCQTMVLPYLRLFSPPGRALVWKKARRLMMELAALVGAGHVQRGREVARPASAGLWGEALRRIVDNPPPRLPLKSHGYLEAVAWDLADRTDRKQETARNADERAGRVAARRDEGEAAPIEALTREALRKIRAEQMGKRRSAKNVDTGEMGGVS